MVRGNRGYISWRKFCQEHGESSRPSEARLYAKRLVESAAAAPGLGSATNRHRLSHAPLQNACIGS